MFGGVCSFCVSLREEQRLRLYENRVVRKVFGPTTDGVAGELRRIHEEELYKLYFSPNVIRGIK